MVARAGGWAVPHRDQIFIDEHLVDLVERLADLQERERALGVRCWGKESERCGKRLPPPPDTPWTSAAAHLAHVC